MREALPSMPSADPPILVDDDTLRAVAQRIAERARDYGLGAGSNVNLRRYSTTSTHPLYIADVTPEKGETQRLVVKFAPIFGRHREGQAEFDNLRVMAARLGTSSLLRVPRALDYYEDVNALITEHRPGPRFSKRILSAPRWFVSARARGALERTSQQCGEWLQIYHDATSRGEGPAIDERFVATMRRDLERIPPRGPLSASRVAIENALGTIMGTLSGRNVPLAVRHGDFSPDNVHLDGEGICVFDLSHHLHAPVYDDVTFFLVTLDTMNPYPKNLAFDRRVARSLASPFLDGYFGRERAGREEGDGDVIAAYTLKNLLTRCLRQRRVATAAGPLALAAFDGILVAGRYRELFARVIERVAGGR